MQRRTVVQPYVPDIRRYREVPTNRGGGEELAGVCMGLRHALTLYAMFFQPGRFLIPFWVVKNAGLCVCLWFPNFDRIVIKVPT